MHKIKIHEQGTINIQADYLFFVTLVFTAFPKDQSAAQSRICFRHVSPNVFPFIAPMMLSQWWNIIKGVYYR